MNILITGAGLIGTHLARRIVDAGDRAIVLDLVPNQDYIGRIAGNDRVGVVAADMRDLPALIQTLKQCNVDTIVHTAGLIGKRVAENTYTGSTNNILGTVNVLEASRLVGIRRVVYVSTFGVYDRTRNNEAAIHESAATGGHNLYTVTKLCSEHLVHGYAFHHRLDAVILRPAGVFGRGLYVGGSTVGMIMRDLALAVMRGEAMTLDAGVYATNEYVYAKDVALAAQLACSAEHPQQRTYNAGSGVVTTAEALAQIVREIAPKTEVKVVGSSGGTGAKSAPLDLTVSKAELGYAPQFSLKEALRDYIDELWQEGARG